MKIQTVVVLGASDKPHRYSYKAVKLLTKFGHNIIPIHPRLSKVNDLSVIANLSDINETVDTLTLYVGSDRSRLLVDKIIQLKPGRVIFNPGTESTLLAEKLSKAGISFVHDCTLIMLESHKFDIPDT
ncbi:MAG: CoA-binding protein [gamma proteobacterium symbiont of Lucinoma myriamae]|nr:CoA-binding protein [gamma proteobacterium symbiont of Lucinoma myriamae]MCU7819104.1 CoA-binding protein [gamma proteobacterium symbiont of Lucinoma myriamae]